MTKKELERIYDTLDEELDKFLNPVEESKVIDNPVEEDS